MAASGVVPWTSLPVLVSLLNCRSSGSRTGSNVVFVTAPPHPISTKGSAGFHSQPAVGRDALICCGRRHPRRLKVVASSSSASSSVEVAADGAEQREKLKEKLLAAMEATDGNLNEECLSIIAQLEKFNPNVDLLNDESKRELWVGPFEGIRASFKGSGRKGEGKTDVGYKGSSATLGRLSYNALQPAALEVMFMEFYNELYEEADCGYLIITVFTFENPRGSNLPRVEGIVFLRASYNNLTSSKQEVIFEAVMAKPRFPEKDLEVWKEVFAENAGGVDENGVVFATLPKTRGSLDYLYIDDEIRITKGQYGAHVVVRKLSKMNPELQVPSIKAATPS